MRRAAPRTAWLVYKAGFGAGLYLGVTTFTLSLIDRVDVGPLTLALIGTTLEVCYTLGEVPTGVFADRRGRKPSILLGLCMVAVSFALVAVPHLAVVLVAQVFIGVGWTFLSGADVAWITDEVGEAAARPLYAAGARAEMLGSVAGIVVGVALGQLTLWVPLVASAAGFLLLALWLAARMDETAPARTHEDRLTLAETVRRTRAQVRARQSVGVVLAVMLAAGLAGEGVDRLWQFHLFEDDAGESGTVVAVGAVFAAGLLFGAGLTGYIERHLRADDPTIPRRLVGIANAGVCVSVVLLAVAPWPVAVGGAIASMALREASYPLVQAWVNRGADPATRATLNSLVGQSESVGEIAGGPVLGAIGATAGVPAALLTSAGVFGIAGLLTRWRPEPALTPGAAPERHPGASARPSPAAVSPSDAA
jgi:DHA3 family tetracycline resistance protein-like MFS transporter